MPAVLIGSLMRTLTSPRVLQHILHACAVVAIISGLGFVVLRIQEGLTMQQTLALQELRIQQLEAQVQALHQTADHNTTQIAATQGYVFGTVVTDLRNLRATAYTIDTERPFLRRQSDIRRRLERLELWRLSVQKGPLDPWPFVGGVH